jgi:hypothetical protein
MADQVKMSAFESRNVSRFGLKLLHIIFSEVPDSGLVCLDNRQGRKYLGNSNQSHIAALAPGASDCSRDPFFNALNSIPKQVSFYRLDAVDLELQMRFDSRAHYWAAGEDACEWPMNLRPARV